MTSLGGHGPCLWKAYEGSRSMWPTNTRGTQGQGHTGCHGPAGAAVLALLFLDLECPCLCSASVTLEQRSLESLLWLFLLCFGPTWSPGQAELINVTLGRRKGELHPYHPVHQGKQGRTERVESCKQQVEEACRQLGNVRKMNRIALLVL